MTAYVVANPMAGAIWVHLPPDAVAGLLATLAAGVRHGGDAAILLDDLATTALNLAKDPSERETSYEQACLAHETALAAS